METPPQPMSHKTARRCVECGEPQQLTRETVPYPESGLDNVQLLNVPVWVCPNKHEELEVPAVEELHNLLAHMIVRQPSPLSGRDIRFIRRRLGLTARDQPPLILRYFRESALCLMCHYCNIAHL